nr:unnamed protein product [Callosobruchus chinensis]
MDIQWLKNKEPIHDETKYYTDYSNNVATLEILNTTVSDSAEYSCLAKNEHGVSISSADLLVVKCFDPTPTPPVFTRPIREHYRISSDELTLECKIRSQPTPTIRWFKDGDELGTGLRHSHAYSADGICRLSIKSPEDGDSGRYTCRVESSSWSDQVSHDVRFTSKEEHVRQRSSKSYRATASVRPYFSNVLTDTFVPTGGSMALQVEESLMLPRASPKHRTFVERGVHTLLVPSVSEYEAGKYTCRASNAFGKVETSAYVHVVHPSSVREGKPPMFLHRPDKILNVAPGEDISVSFRVRGDPKPTGSERHNEQYAIDEVPIGRLPEVHIKRATEEDAGTYCILAKNRHGCDRAFFTVRLRHRARSLTPTTTTSTKSAEEILSDIPPTEKGRCLPVNVPGPIPGPPVVTDTGRNWVSLSWGRPEHRGAAPVIAYRVEAWRDARWAELGVTATNCFDAFDLAPGEGYQFRVTPRNRSLLDLDKATDLPPQFTMRLRDRRVQFTYPVRLTCQVAGIPEPTVTWYRNGKEILSDERYTLCTDDNFHTLEISRTALEDSGMYSVTARNSFGAVSCRCNLVVDKGIKGYISPAFCNDLEPSMVEIREGRELRLSGRVEAYPSVGVMWYRDGLSIAGVTKQDGGVYSCVASNEVGRAESTAKVVVLDRDGNRDQTEAVADQRQIDVP